MEIEYPCMSIEGADIEEEIKVLKSLCVTERTRRTISLYLNFEGQMLKIGLFECSLNNLLKLRYVSDNYKFFYWQDKDNSVEMDMLNPEHLATLLLT